ncbi:MAG: acyl-phosphate glycerol 3-phosphate acyltransferase [Nitrospirae bacterium CG_4_10_14_0_8_um_filter_41_23]|nr:MAG: acyl-phosphate glycerol 3-phosphate acyltransferase [Nitrospirae bacterium CG02_land_8_20_14_3_00_41_53]PIW87341.1 MAG: acyl-phosphate glycerol 3-phosphate acyltransferase [Nitrospirae bacterium CG_4_8_14_3_um_filter_41_47]PIY87817.1 MAG: acyl-phosphate glycerol 3-phosphate acyltransferase [Nitrospirae bacterium CG_4_10_14_0_8_um_filter_41_23]PJA79938.1 MAG: acyl-phosphate glycerol 3-phosphate acyltransferase [Nitrospirae bacterium CG_4_9_14_3_um_filter_41_27]
MIKYILLFITAFLLGSIPFGIIIAKAKGVNLKKVGSGNIGATNVLRSLGKWPAALTLLGDVLKGTAAIAIGRYLGAGPVYEGLVGFSAILGHNFSIFLGFRGGKGVATSLGVLSIYSPQIALFTFIIWLVVVIFTKYSSMGALVSFGLLPINILFFDGREKLFTAILITILIFIRHRDNIQRLIKGTERKIGQRE